MTTRSTLGSISGRHVIREYQISNPGGAYNVHGPFNLVRNWTDTVSYGDNIPNWREKLRDGLSATTSLNGERYTCRLTNGFAKVIYFGNQWTDEMSGSHHINVTKAIADPADLDVSKANAEALVRFNQRIRAVRTAFEGGVFLGELGQTLRMIRNPAMGLRKMATDFRQVAQAIRRQKVSAITAALKRATIARNLADAWLEVQFGWKPLLHDIDDASKALAIYNARKSLETRRITAKSQVDGSSTDTTTGSAVAAMYWRLRERTTGHCLVIYRGAMRVKAKDPQEMDAALIGFDPSSFVPTAWELIPYSFLIDYFTNIGGIITGWSNLFTELSWCNRTEKVWNKLVIRSEKDPNSPYGYTSFAPAEFVGERIRVSRAEFTGSLVPEFVFRVPSMDSLRWLNIAALIAGRNSDRKWVYGN